MDVLNMFNYFVLIEERESNGKLPKIFAGENLRMTQKSFMR